MLEFRIYYGDGSTYEGNPEDAPSRNVQCIAWPDKKAGSGNLGRYVVHSWDFYIFSDTVGGWHVTNHIHDLLDHLSGGVGPGGVRRVLTGRWISTDAFKEIYERAMAEGNWKPKNALASPNDIVEDGRENL